jgi:hypothetical protein
LHRKIQLRFSYYKSLDPTDAPGQTNVRAHVRLLRVHSRQASAPRTSIRIHPD